MRVVRIGLVAAALVVALVLTGCSGGGTAKKAEVSSGGAESAGAAKASAESSASAGKGADQYAGSLSAAGAAVGAELQRTKDWKLGGEAWVMSVAGKSDLDGPDPRITIIAVNPKGDRTAIWSLPKTDAGTGSSFQGSFSGVPIPSGTTTLLVASSVKSKDATAAPPVLTVDLATVPAVDAVNANQE